MQISTFLPEVDRESNGLISSIDKPTTILIHIYVRAWSSVWTWRCMYCLYGVLVADGNNYLLIAVVSYWCPGTPRNKGRSMVS